MTIRTRYKHSLPEPSSFYKLYYANQGSISRTHEKATGSVVTYEMQISRKYESQQDYYYYFRSIPIFAPEKMLNRYMQLWCEYYGN